MLVETIIAARAMPATPAGTWATIAGTGTTAFSVLDTSALFGPGADNPGQYALCQFQATVTGGAGVPGAFGGWYLAAHHLTAAAAVGTPAAAGAGIFGPGQQPNYASVITTNSPQAWWQLSDPVGSGVAADSSGGNHPGTATSVTFGIPALIAGGAYTCASFGGTAASSGILTGWNPAEPAITVEAWVNLDGQPQSGNPRLLANSHSDLDFRGFQLMIQGPGNAGPLFIVGNGTVAGSATTATALPQTGWSYLAGTWDGGTVRLYVNGAQAAASAFTGSLAAGVSTVGIGYDPAYNGDYFDGLLAQCAVYGTALTSQQILAHYTSGINSGLPSYEAGGVIQAQGTVSACSWYLDLLDVGTSTLYPAAFTADATAVTLLPPANSTDTAGITSRMAWIWAGVSTDGGTVSATPVPQQNWSGTISSSLLNGPAGPTQALTFLNNPPLLRVSAPLATAVPAGTATALRFTSPGLPDTYSGWGTAASSYTCKLPGLYLASPLAAFTNMTTGQCYTGLSVNGTAVTLQGPAYGAVTIAGGVTAPGQVRVLDLSAGDTVSAWCYQSAGTATTLAGAAAQSRLTLTYLAPYSAGGVATATPPYTPFRWQAGLPPAQLPQLLSEHLGNDLSFLVNRPYFTGTQGTAQTGFANGTWNAVGIDTPGGIVHGSPGDSYAGWNTASNTYVAKQPGWYLCVAEAFATPPATAGGYLTCGLSVPSSGGQPSSVSVDWYQSVYCPFTTGAPPGASAVGVYYLLAGEGVQPMIRAAGWGGTWGTFVSPSVRSQFTVCWICE